MPAPRHPAAQTHAHHKHAPLAAPAHPPPPCTRHPRFIPRPLNRPRHVLHHRGRQLHELPAWPLQRKTMLVLPSLRIRAQRRHTLSVGDLQGLRIPSSAPTRRSPEPSSAPDASGSPRDILVPGAAPPPRAAENPYLDRVPQIFRQSKPADSSPTLPDNWPRQNDSPLLPISVAPPPSWASHTFPAQSEPACWCSSSRFIFKLRMLTNCF